MNWQSLVRFCLDIVDTFHEIIVNISKRGAMLLDSHLPVSAGFKIERRDKKKSELKIV